MNNEEIRVGNSFKGKPTAESGLKEQIRIPIQGLSEQPSVKYKEAYVVSEAL